MNVNVFDDISDKRLDETLEATSCYASLQVAMKLVLEGWSVEKRGTHSVCITVF